MDSEPPGSDRLMHWQELAERKLGAYYDELNDHEPFALALRELYARARLHIDYASKIPAAIRPDIFAFRDRWALRIRGGAYDLWWSLGFAYDVGDDPRIQPFNETTVSRTFGLPATEIMQRSDGTGTDPENPSLLIRPNVPLPFRYDPTRRGAAWVRARASALARDIRESIVAQAQLIEQDANEAGWHPIPPRDRSDPELTVGARRLFGRAVLKWSWQRIADAERPDSSPRVDTQSVRRTIVDWAKELGVPLPEATSPDSTNREGGLLDQPT